MNGVPSHRAALAEARRLGCSVEPVKRTGEVRISDPHGCRVNCNNRRQDASRALLSLIRHLEVPKS